MHIRFICKFIGISIFAGGVASAAPSAFKVDIERVVNSSTPLPNDQNLNFDSIDPGSIVTLDNEVVFSNFSTDFFGNPSKNGLYRSANGKIELLAATGEQPFKSGAAFDESYTAGGPTVFRALTSTAGSPVSSIWISDAGSLTNIVPIGAELPDGAGSASFLSFPRISGNDVVFSGIGNSRQSRIYRTSTNGAPLTSVIDENTGPEFDNVFLDIGDFQNDQFVFRTFDTVFASSTGVYAGDLDGNTTEISRAGDPVPNQPDFEFFRYGGDTTYPSMDNGRIAFTGQGFSTVEPGVGSQGIYTTSITGDSLEVVVDNNTILPNDNGVSTAFGAPSISGDNVAFIGVGNGSRGKAAFVSINGVIVDIIHVGDMLDGRIVSNVLSGSFALNGNQLAFTVDFTNGDSGLYMATIIPSPGAATVVALGGVLAARRRRSVGR